MGEEKEDFTREVSQAHHICCFRIEKLPLIQKSLIKSNNTPVFIIKFC